MTLQLNNNNIRIINISSNVNLEFLNLRNNNLTSLDVSMLPKLGGLAIYNNQDLEVLNVKNGNNAPFQLFLAYNNPKLTCIEVDDVSFFNSNFPAPSSIDNTASYSINCNYPKTSVPDVAFENYLETHDRDGNVVAITDPNNMGNGIANDAKVFTHRINTVTTINVSNIGLALLTGIEGFRDLEDFNAYGGNTSLTSVDLSNNLKLKKILVTNNANLTTVTFGNLPEVTWVQLSFNKVSSVDISRLPKLDYFFSQSDKLSTLNTASNPNLKNLVLTGNQLTTLDVSSNPKLENLKVRNNQLTILNLSNNPSLTQVLVGENQLTNLNLSNNPKLVNFEADNNKLTSLNLKNGNNTILPGSYGPNFTNFPFDIRNNPNLTCIQVNDVAYSTTTWTAIDSQHTFSTSCANSLTYVPDDAFETYLETHAADGNVVTITSPNNMGNGIANDNYVFTNRINTVSILRVNNQSISDMTGIEDFLSLQVLDATTNNINTIDVTSLASIYQLAIGFNPITGIDVSQNNNLRILEVVNTGLITLDVTSNAVLEFLKIDNTPLTTVDTSQNSNLKTFSAEVVPLTQVDLSNNSILEYLELRDNSLTSLDISNNLLLQIFVLTGSPLIGLDLYKHDKLIEVRLNNNPSLAQLNLKNTANTNIPTSSFDITNNPSLTCIEVDDVTYSNTNWTSIDSQHVFNTTCSSQQITLIPDPVFEQKLINLSIDSDGVVNGQVFTADINTVTNLFLACTFNCSTAPKITDLSGIEDFAALGSLNIQNNNVSGVLDLTNNINLLAIDVSLNSITDLKLNGLNLYDVSAYNNNISSLDLSTSSNLLSLNVNNNNISSLDLSSNPNVTQVLAKNNQLTSINISNNTLIEYLDVKNNQLTVVDLTNKSELFYIDISDNNLIGLLDISNRTKLNVFICSNNSISELIFKDNLDNSSNIVVSLECANNNITKLDASGSRVNILDASNNFITDLRLTAEAELTLIKLNNNQLTQLDLKSKMRSNANFYFADFDFRNNNLQCIEVDNPSTLIPIFTNIDSGTTITTDCSSVWTVMTNPATTTALLAITGLDVDNDGKITLAEAAAFTGTLDLSGQSLTDVEGLQAFINVTKIDLQNNNITDFSPLTDASIPIIQKSTGKTKTQARTGAFNLEELYISNNNNVESLDVSKLTKLKKLIIKDNPKLITVSIQNGNNATITEFDSSNTPNLTCILVDNVGASYLSTWIKDPKNTFVATESECRAKVLDVDTFELSSNILIYPNPISDIINIKVQNGLKVNKVKIISILGKTIMEQSKNRFNISRLSKGIYLIKIITDKGIVTRKVIKR